MTTRLPHCTRTPRPSVVAGYFARALAADRRPWSSAALSALRNDWDRLLRSSGASLLLAADVTPGLTTGVFTFPATGLMWAPPRLPAQHSLARGNRWPGRHAFGRNYVDGVLGGTSGPRVVQADNHWPIACHVSNFPETDHYMGAFHTTRES